MYSSVCVRHSWHTRAGKRELITAFRPAFQAFNLERREQSEEFVLFSDRLVQSELRVSELCAPCLWHVLVLVCVCVLFLFSLAAFRVVSAVRCDTELLCVSLALTTSP